MDETYQAPRSPCPACGYRLDAHAVVHGEEAPPAAGDFTCCFNCARPLIFGADRELRKATPEELAELKATDPEAFAELRRWQRMLVREKAERN